MGCSGHLFGFGADGPSAPQARDHNVLSLMPDPSSEAPILSFKYPEEIEVIGQVVGLAISLDPEKQRRIRS